MEDILFIILCFITSININIKGANEFFVDYMDIVNTNQIKGIFVWMIILKHYKSYYKTKIYTYIKILNFIGQKVVSMFFFYSSFGIYESIKKKGINYIKTLPKKIMIIFIKSQLILLIFLLCNYILGIKVKLKIYLLSMIFKKNIGNSYWFAFTILSLYFYTFISFLTLKNERIFLIGIIIVNIISIFHIYLVYNFYYPKSMFSVDNILAFNIGFYYSLLKEYLDKIILKNDILYFGILSFTILIFHINKQSSVLTVSNKNAIFCLVVILISMKVRFKNNFLQLLSSHSYSIYLLQRVVMRFVYYKHYFEKNEIIRFFFEFIVIILISILFDKYTSFIDKFFKRENPIKIKFFKKEKNELLYLNNYQIVKII